MEKINERAALEIALSMLKNDFSKELRKVVAPTLIVSERKDKLTILEDMIKLAEEVIPNGKLTILEKGNHWLPTVYPEELAWLVEDFLV